MAEHPILFSGEMVRAILEGRKTQTRRVIKTDALEFVGDHSILKFAELDTQQQINVINALKCPYGAAGDWLWVRETWRVFSLAGVEPYTIESTTIEYKARASRGTVLKQCKRKHSETKLPKRFADKWHPSIHMPRWASRINLEIVTTRVERLQQITNADAKAEGCEMEMANGQTITQCAPEYACCWDYRLAFHELWDSINAKRGYGWDTNPFVWCIEFKKIYVPTFNVKHST